MLWASVSPLGLESNSSFPSPTSPKDMSSLPINMESGKDFVPGQTQFNVLFLAPSLPPSHLPFLYSNIWYLPYARAVLGPEDTEDRWALPQWNL